MQKLRCCLQLWVMALVLVYVARARGHRTCASPSSKCKCIIDKRRGYHIICHHTTTSGKVPKFKKVRAGPERYRSIGLEELNITRVQNNAFAYLKVSNIMLDKNPLEKGVSKGAFSGLEKILRILLITRCNLTIIPGQAIRHLRSLKQLNLQYNKIGEIKRGDFKKKSKLYLLNLSYNYILVLKKGIFKSLKNLEQLYLNRNRIQGVSRSTFHGLHKLQTLEISGNAIKTLRRGIFREMKQLDILNLSENYIESLPTGVFQGLNKLTYLNLRSNSIKALERRSFLGLHKLKNLDVSDNPISVIVEGTFKTSASLNILYLDAISVVNWSRKSFKGAAKLSYVNLGKVNWTVIPNRLFEPLTNLTKLMFTDSNNIFEKFPLSAFSKSTNLAQVQIFIVRTKKRKCSLGWVQELVHRGIGVNFQLSTYNYTRCYFDRLKALAGG